MVPTTQSVVVVGEVMTYLSEYASGVRDRKSAKKVKRVRWKEECILKEICVWNDGVGEYEEGMQRWRNGQ